MRPAQRLLGLLGLLLLASAQWAEARGVTVYIQRVIVADPGNIRLGDLVQPSGDAPASAGETLSQDVASVVANHILYIPSRSYMDRVEDAFGRDSIFVGSRSLVIPRGALPDSEIPLLDRLADFLSASGVLGDDVSDIEIRSIRLVGALPQNPVPSFQLVRSSRGSVETSFTVAGDAPQASGRIILELKSDPRATVAEVRASDPVRVVFHKGPITIEMQGKALGAAAVGQAVNVLVSDSQKSFTGTLQAGKAVDVELP